jgi:hypothetical protein
VKGSFKKRSYLDPKTGGKRRVTTWTVTYDEPTSPDESRRQRRRGGFATRRDAETWFDDKKKQLEQGLTGVDDKTTLANYLKHWLANASVGAGTRRMYESYARCFVVPVLGHIRLRDLKPPQVEDAKRRWAIRKKREEGDRLVSSRAVRHAWSVLATALSRAKKQRIIVFNPCEYVDAPRFERRERCGP